MLRIHELLDLESPRIEPRSQQGLQHSRPHRVTGFGFDKSAMRKSGWAVVALTALISVSTLALAWRFFGAGA